MLEQYLKRQKELLSKLLETNQEYLTCVEEVCIKDLKNTSENNSDNNEKLLENKSETISIDNLNLELKIIDKKEGELKNYLNNIEEQVKTISTNGDKNKEGINYFEQVVRKSLFEKLLENGIKKEIEKNYREKIYWSITELNECLLKTLFKNISSEESKRRFLKDNYNPLLSLYGVSGDSVHKLIQEYLQEQFKEKVFPEYTIIEEKFKIKGRLDILIKDTTDIIIEIKTTNNKQLNNPYLSHYNQCQIQMFCMKEAENSFVNSAILWYLPVDKYFLIEYDERYINELKPRILKLTNLYERFKLWKEERQKKNNKIYVNYSKKSIDEEFVAFHHKEMRFIKDERFCKFCEFKEWCYRYNIISDRKLF